MLSRVRSRALKLRGWGPPGHWVYVGDPRPPGCEHVQLASSPRSASRVGT